MLKTNRRPSPKRRNTQKDCTSSPGASQKEGPEGHTQPTKSREQTETTAGREPCTPDGRNSPDRKGPTSPDPCARHKNCRYLAGCTNHAVIEILSWKEPFQIFAAFPWRAKTSVAASHASHAQAQSSPRRSGICSERVPGDRGQRAVSETMKGPNQATQPKGPQK